MAAHNRLEFPRACACVCVRVCVVSWWPMATYTGVVAALVSTPSPLGLTPSYRSTCVTRMKMTSWRGPS